VTQGDRRSKPPTWASTVAHALGSTRGDDFGPPLGAAKRPSSRNLSRDLARRAVEAGPKRRAIKEKTPPVGIFPNGELISRLSRRDSSNRTMSGPSSARARYTTLEIMTALRDDAVVDCPKGQLAGPPRAGSPGDPRPC
jgi:hypothetical protein